MLYDKYFLFIIYSIKERMDHFSSYCQNKGLFFIEFKPNAFYSWPNPSQIRCPAYAYVTDYFGIKGFLFFSKNYLTRIFLFFCCNKISCVQQCRKIPRKSLLRNKFFQCNFQTATVSSVF